MTGQTEFPPTETDAAVTALDAQIAAERSTIAQIEASLREHRLALNRLADARKAVLGQRRRRVQVRRVASSGKTAFQRAGRGNVEKARDLLTHNGPMAKAAITRSLGINDGTVVYALRALEETGEVRRTGERVNGSDVFEIVTRGRRGVTRPGDRRG